MARQKATLAPLAAQAEGAPESAKPFEYVDASTSEVAKRLIALREEQAKHEKAAAEAKKKADEAEAALVESFAAEGLQSVNIDGRTVYRRKDLIVSKAAGVATDSVVEAIQAAGWGSLIGESYNANTLKASVRECRERAAAAGFAGRRAFYDSISGEFYAEDGEIPTIGSVSEVVDGIPVELFPLLYIEEKSKIGIQKG
jgi:hypothetical protein